ncbi:MAG: DUF3501 family protein [Candidatus Kapaibacterium sp.]|jgi:hypothetical protein
MRPIELSDVKNIYEYEKIRNDNRTSIIAEKKNRRVALGPNMTFIFENRNTVLFQIQEMLRTERIITDEGMQSEVDVYNALIPGDSELSATLLVEITDKDQIRPILDSLVGLGHNSIFLVIGEHEIPAIFDEAQSSVDRISAVQYLRWQLNETDVEQMRSSQAPVTMISRHKNYAYSTTLTNEQRASLLADLSEVLA